MRILFHIFKFKFLSFVKSQAIFNLNSIIKSFGTSIIYLLFAVGIYFFAQNLISYMLDEVKIGSFLLHRFIFIVLFLFFMVVNIGNIVVSYSTIFKTKEVGYLLTKPVSFTKIFLIKFLDNFFYSSSTLLLMVTAAISGYASYYKLTWTFIPFAITFLIIPFMFIAGTLGAIILLLILNLAGRFGIKRIIGLLASVYATAVIVFYISSSPIELVTKVFAYFPNINNYFGYLESPLLKLLPNYWVADSLYWITSGRPEAAGWYIYLLIVTSVLFLMLAMFLAKKWFYKTWLLFLNISSELSIKKRKTDKDIFSLEKFSALKPIREVLIKRELLLFIREPSQWTHFLVMLFLISIFILSISNIDVAILKYYNVYLKTLIYLIIYLFNVFLIASLSLRFIFPLVSLEGQTIWKIRSAPLNVKKLLLTRLLVYFSVIFVIGQMLNFVSNYQFSFLLTIFSQLNTTFITVTLVSLNFGMGSFFANYKEKNPIRVASSQGASLTFLFTIIYLAFLVILLFTPINNYFTAMATGYTISIQELFMTNIILGLLAITSSYVSISSGIKQFSKDI